jgi:PAS domain S-box-containing protein
MDPLARLIAASEDRLMKMILGYALQRGYTKYSSTLEEAWRMSVAVLSKTLTDACETWDGPPELGPDEDYLCDPIARFGIAEAQKHRERGISIDMFLGLMKYYRQSYLDVVSEAGFERAYEETCRLFVNRLYDRIELGFCKEWVRTEQSDRIEDLQEKNRTITTEKNKFLTVYESLPDPVILINTEMKIENMNRAAMLLLRRGDVPGGHYYRSLATEDLQHEDRLRGQGLEDLFPWLMADIRRFAAGEEQSATTERYLQAVPESIFFAVQISRMLDISRKFSGMIVLLSDITKRKKTEREREEATEALRESEKRYRQLFESMISGFALHELIRDQDGRPCDYRFLDINPAFERLTGLKVEDLIGNTVRDVLPATEDFWIETYGRVATTGESLHFEHHSKALDRHFEVTAYRTETDRFATIFHDITDRKRTEEALTSEKELLRVTLASIGDGVITTDVHGNINSINRVAEELTGWPQDQASGRNLADVFHIVDEQTREICENPVDKVLKSGGIVGLSNHTALIRRDGMEMIIDDSGSPIRDREGKIIGVVLVFRDVAEKERTQRLLQNARKLEAVGELAGGIAHDFNNLLGGIFGYLDLAHLQAEMEGNSRVAETLSKATDVLDKAKYLTQQLLTFSKGGAPIRKTQSITECIRKSVSFALSGSNIVPVLKIPADIWLCDIDKNQVEQVLDSMTINARQAMPQGGKLEVVARNVPVGEGPDGLPPLAYVRVSIHDQGPGIPKENLPRIFEPFFTTKQMGSGLGLATSYSIVKKHGGQIDVESEVGKGTAFHIYLPASSPMVSIEKPTGQDTQRGSGKILVMDDEPHIREVLAAMLERMGYEAVPAKDGDEALTIAQSAIQKGEPFVAAILDLTVPGGRGGEETAPGLLEMDPGIRMIASSGYSEDPIMANPSVYGFAARLIKPYRMVDLTDALASARIGSH